MNIQNKKILFLGDSITEGYGPQDIENVYWKRLERNCGCISVGYGISGTRSARQQKPSVNPREDQYFRSRVASMDQDADVVVVFGGTNDYGHGDAAIGHFDDRTDDTFYGALHNLYTDLIAKYPTAQLVVMTPLHRVGENKVYNDFGVRCVGSLQDYVNIIMEVAGYYGIPVLDLHRLSGIQPEVPALREAYAPDGLHPNDAGHALLYSRLKGFLETL